MAGQSSIRTGRKWLAVAALVALEAACAARTTPPVVTAPRYPDFFFPEVPADLTRGATPAAHRAAWQWLQAGDAATAARQFADLLKRTPDFYPAAAGLGYAQLARREYRDALASFDRALARNSRYAPALVGRGDALAGLGDTEAARRAYEAALTVDPSLVEVRRRAELVGLRHLQDLVRAARRARDEGRHPEARAAYERALALSPESALLYRELGEVDRELGAADRAEQHLRRATELDPADGLAWRLLGELAEQRGDLAAAEAAYERAAALDAHPDLAARLGRLRARMRLAALPPEYRALPEAASMTRAGLAALIGVRFEALLARARPSGAPVLTDTRGHWAARWILAVVRAGVMEAYPNHTFQPEGLVRRGDLAHAVSRLLALIRAEGRLAAPDAPRRAVSFADLGPTHLSYRAAADAVAAGVLAPLEGNTFQLARPVSGPEVVAALDRLAALTGERQP
jgi:tetratricopeptide (TPR) repeat protein